MGIHIPYISLLNGERFGATRSFHVDRPSAQHQKMPKKDTEKRCGFPAEVSKRPIFSGKITNSKHIENHIHRL